MPKGTKWRKHSRNFLDLEASKSISFNSRIFFPNWEREARLLSSSKNIQRRKREDTDFLTRISSNSLKKNKMSLLPESKIFFWNIPKMMVFQNFVFFHKFFFLHFFFFYIFFINFFFTFFFSQFFSKLLVCTNFMSIWQEKWMNW